MERLKAEPRTGSVFNECWPAAMVTGVEDGLVGKWADEGL